MDRKYAMEDNIIWLQRETFAKTQFLESDMIIVGNREKFLVFFIYFALPILIFFLTYG